VVLVGVLRFVGPARCCHYIMEWRKFILQINNNNLRGFGRAFFNMKGGIGCATHTNDANFKGVTQNKMLHSAEFPKQVEKLFQDIGKNNVSVSVALNMIHQRTGDYVSYSNFHYLSGKNKSSGNDIITSGDDFVNCMRKIGICTYSFLLRNIEEHETSLSYNSLQFHRLGKYQLL